MKHIIALCAVITCLVITTNSQTLSTDDLRGRVNSANAENNISVEFDGAAKTTKILAVSENFSKSEVSRSGILAMNFAIGVIFAGDSLTASPDTFLFTFWVLAKKPRFGENHSMTVTTPDELLVIGSARYNGRPREQMEYLNFEISREKLAKIVMQPEVRFQLGEEQFTFTRSQMKLLSDVLMITKVGQ